MKKSLGFILQHPAGIRISRELTEQQLLATQLAGPGQRDRLNLWVWYCLPSFDEKPVVLSVWLGFKAGKLEVISLKDIDPQISDTPANWTEVRERDRAERISRWLTSKGFPPGNYEWGTVAAVFDEKIGSGFAEIQFALS